MRVRIGSIWFAGGRVVVVVRGAGGAGAWAVVGGAVTVTVEGEQGEEGEADQAAERGGEAGAAGDLGGRVGAVGDDVEEEAGEQGLKEAEPARREGVQGCIGEQEAGDGGDAEADHGDAGTEPAREAGAEQLDRREQPPHGDGDRELMGDDGDLEGVAAVAGGVGRGEGEAVGERVDRHADDRKRERGAVGAA